MRPALRILFAGLAGLGMFQAGQAGGQTLSEALAQAYLNNPTLRAERARLRATDEGVAQAVSNWRPSLSATGTYSWEEVENDNGTSDTTPKALTLSAEQNIFRGGRSFAAARRARALVRADRARLGSVEQAVMLRAVQAYVDVVRDQAVERLNANNERVLRRQLEATRDRFRVGEVTRTDVAQAESRVARTVADRIDSRSRLVQSRATFRNVVGIQPRQLTRPTLPDGLPASETAAIRLAAMESFAVLQARHSADAASARVTEVIGEMLPTVAVTGSYSMNRDTESLFGDPTTTRVIASVRVPLYQSGAVASRVREAKQTRSQRQSELIQAQRDAQEEATRAWEAFQTAQAQIKAFSAQIRASEIALRGVEQEALVGSRTLLDVLDAEQELLDSRVNLVRAERNELVAAHQLRAAVGRLTAHHLNLKAKKYNPEQNYDRVRGKWFGIGVETD